MKCATGAQARRRSLEWDGDAHCFSAISALVAEPRRLGSLQGAETGCLPVPRRHGDGQGTLKTPSGTSTVSADSFLFHINQKPVTRNEKHAKGVCRRRSGGWNHIREGVLNDFRGSEHGGCVLSEVRKMDEKVWRSPRASRGFLWDDAFFRSFLWVSPSPSLKILT